MLSRYGLMRSVVSASRLAERYYVGVQGTVNSNSLNARTFSVRNKADEKVMNPISPKKKRGFLERVLAADSSGRNSLLKALGYYSAESRAIGAGTSLYHKALARASAVTLVELEDDLSFSAWFEMVSVHIYLTLRRLRAEKGSLCESDVKTAMQCLFDVFWTDVRSRMIKDHEMTLITSGKWVKECEQIFFGLAMAFDEGWEDIDVMRDAIRRNVTCLAEDNVKVEHFRKYMMKEYGRLQKISVKQMLDATTLDGEDTVFRSA
ncbi:unnamed protein product [Agarophyton chilense]